MLFHALPEVKCVITETGLNFLFDELTFNHTYLNVIYILTYILMLINTGFN